MKLQNILLIQTFCFMELTHILEKVDNCGGKYRTLRIDLVKRLHAEHAESSRKVLTWRQSRGLPEGLPQQKQECTKQKYLHQHFCGQLPLVEKGWWCRDLILLFWKIIIRQVKIMVNSASIHDTMYLNTQHSIFFWTLASYCMRGANFTQYMIRQLTVTLIIAHMRIVIKTGYCNRLENCELATLQSKCFGFL